ncbi:hypothetical protein CALVIDRAFT_484730 [Calocera viscosa TUFC12733]|uniref:Uncharacterized protein n=1 Tax=Calocera viscosa (strain TUFC12733) TaxID=1330018 RepID=A0A167K5I8_CALVF|nr:hypothetical protein CALVIDRAFT_484730 [Calocera viscosa TUFC12733]
MPSRDADRDHLGLPTTTYLPRIPRSKRRQFRLTPSGRKILLYLTGLILLGLLLQQSFVREWKSTTLSWSVLSSSTAEECQPVTSPQDSDQWTLERLQQMINGTRGYYTRDYSLWLGWNNMRYIIEAGVLQAALLNRTLIIPSFVYARQCEVGLEVCAAFLEMVNRGDAMNWDEWRWLPMEKQMGWKIPIGLMIEMKHLRQTHAVITMEEYLRLHSLPTDLEQGNGQWIDSAYRVESRPIPNSWWDPPGVIRVDQQRPPFVLDEADPMSVQAFQAREDVKAIIEDMMERQPQRNALQHTVLDWEPVRHTLRSMDLDVSDDSNIELFLRAAAFEVVHTYQGSLTSEFIKSVAMPIKQVARMSDVHGAIDDFGSWNDTVVHMQGEVHDNRKPGFLRFTSVPNLEYFTRTVLNDIRSLPDLAALAVRVDERMRERTGGRLWRAAHVRRGDFIRMGWSDASLARHMDLVKSKLSLAPEIWQEIRSREAADTLGELDAHVNPEDDIPRIDDPFYIATEERNPQALDYMRSQGGVLIMDLLKPEDRQIVGWPLLISDILALAEQHIMGRSAYFYGNSMSSVTGGVLNLRAINGWDSRTTAPE